MSTMSIPTRVASPFIASIFIVGGLDAALDPEGKVKKAEAVTHPIARRVTVLPDDTETLVRLNGATQVAAGTMLSFGIWRRLAATVLVGSLVPTTLAGHRFWEELDEDARKAQMLQFAKNLGLLGGLLLIATTPAIEVGASASRASLGGSRQRFRTLPVTLRSANGALLGGRPQPAEVGPTTEGFRHAITTGFGAVLALGGWNVRGGRGTRTRSPDGSCRSISRPSSSSRLSSRAPARPHRN